VTSDVRKFKSLKVRKFERKTTPVFARGMLQQTSAGNCDAWSELKRPTLATGSFKGISTP
jgi:hypothetical protein